MAIEKIEIRIFKPEDQEQINFMMGQIQQEFAEPIFTFESKRILDLALA